MFHVLPLSFSLRTVLYVLEVNCFSNFANDVLMEFCNFANDGKECNLKYVVKSKKASRFATHEFYGKAESSSKNSLNKRNEASTYIIYGVWIKS